MRGKSYCIICLKQRRGIPVENDYVLSAARWFKANITKNEKNNTLVVCKDDYVKYRQMRRRYESRQRIYLALGIAFAVISLLVSPHLGTAISAAVVVILLLAFSLLGYTPRIDIKNQHDQ